MLDEPTEGVWIGVIEEIAERLQQLAQEISLIIVEQHVELALRVADRAYVMERGTMALEGHDGLACHVGQVGAHNEIHRNTNPKHERRSQKTPSHAKESA